MTILEDVIDLSARREQKRKDEMPDVDIAEALANIDETINLTVEYLGHHGMTAPQARKVILKHLSDIVMSHDISK